MKQCDSNNIKICSVTIIHSVGSGMGEVRGRKADVGVGRVIDVVEPLEEGVAIDEVEAFARGRAEVRRHEIDALRVAADQSVQLYEAPVSVPQ